MADAEIESFLTKFKHLCSVGINASLNISSSQGKAIVTLHAEIGAFSAPTAPQTPLKNRSPSYHRRIARRHAMRHLNENRCEEARQASTEVDEVIGNEAAKPADVDTAAATKSESSYVNEVAEQAVLDSNIDIVEIEDMDKDEMERDRLVDEVVVYAVPPSDCRQSMQDANEVEGEVKERFSSLGVIVTDMRIKVNRKGKFESSLVKISPPVNLNRIWGRRLGLTNCAVVEFKKVDIK